MSAPRNSKRSRLAAAAVTLARQDTPQLLVPSKQQDPMAFFSEEVALHIFETLSPSDLGKCACVSRLWHRLVNDQVVSLFLTILTHHYGIHVRPKPCFSNIRTCNLSLLALEETLFQLSIHSSKRFDHDSRRRTGRSSLAQSAIQSSTTKTKVCSAQEWVSTTTTATAHRSSKMLESALQAEL